MARCYLSIYCPGIESNRLLRLVEWCERYSPLVAPDGQDGIQADITGCAHLFGGEGPLLLDVRRRLHWLGMESYAAIADAPSIAWALARFGKRFLVHGEAAVAELDRMPVEALRLPLEIAEELPAGAFHHCQRAQDGAQLAGGPVWVHADLASRPAVPASRRSADAVAAAGALPRLAHFRRAGFEPPGCGLYTARTAARSLRAAGAEP